MFVPDLLAGKRILVTGGGTGIGRSIGHRYSQLGADLVICGRREAVLRETAREIGASTGRRVTWHACDIRDPAAVEAMTARIWEDGPLDVLMNNASGNFIARTETLSSRAFDAVLNTVLHGTVYCTLAAARRWIAAGRPGAVLAILTTAAYTGSAYTTPNASAKAGVLAMLKSLAVEWGPRQIRTAAVAPGLFPTEGAQQRLYPEDARPEPQERDIPLGRVGDHAELANLCAYLASDQASYITGECVVIDGGRWLKTARARNLESWTPAQWDAFRAASRG